MAYFLKLFKELFEKHRSVFSALDFLLTSPGLGMSTAFWRLILPIDAFLPNQTSCEYHFSAYNLPEAGFTIELANSRGKCRTFKFWKSSNICSHPVKIKWFATSTFWSSTNLVFCYFPENLTFAWYMSVFQEKCHSMVNLASEVHIWDFDSKLTI